MKLGQTLVLVALVTACGGSTQSASTVNGATFTPKGGFAVFGTNATDSFVNVNLFDVANAQSLAAPVANMSGLNVYLDEQPATTPLPIAPGTYNVSSSWQSATTVGGVVGQSNFTTLDSKCQPVIPLTDPRTQGAGTITVTSISATGIGGSYALTFQNGSLQGTFDVPVVGAFPAGLAGGTTCSN